MWYADYTAALGSVEWWDKLVKLGPGFGNTVKTWLVTKNQHLLEAYDVFDGSGVNVTSDGRPYLGGV